MWSLVLLSFLIGAKFYPQLTPQVATHWNARGEVDGSMPRFWAAFLVPFLLVALAALFMLLPHIDPRRQNYAAFRSAYEAFAILLTLYMISIESFVMLWGVGIHLDPNVIFSLGTGFLFLFIGSFLARVRPNWFVGIRTPWTLSNEESWRKTHQLGSRLFQGLGILLLLTALLSAHVLPWVLLGGLGVVVLVLFVYSYRVVEEAENGHSGGVSR